jgi:hypothetical protein
MLHESERPLPPQVFLGTRPNHCLRALTPHLTLSKPAGGLWTCDYRPRSLSVWAEYAAREFDSDLREKYARARAWRLRVLTQAKVFVINGKTDLLWLQEHYPYSHDEEFRHGLVDDLIHEIWYPCLDWPKIAEAFDGVRLSARGWHILGRGYNRGYSPLSDWSVPSTVWTRWVFDETSPQAIGDGDTVRALFAQL